MPMQGAHSDLGGVMDHIVSQLLSELDSIASSSAGRDGSGDVFVIGTTNRSNLLNPVLLCPRRFNRLLYFSMSDMDSDLGQPRILKVLTPKFHLDPGHMPNLSLHIAQCVPHFQLSQCGLHVLCADALLKAHVA